MASQDHEILVELLRSDPRLVPELIRDPMRALGIDLPPEATVKPIDASLPSLVSQFAADMLFRIDGDGGELVIVAEVQLAIAPGKKRSWPVYEAHARAREDAPTIVVVLTPDARVAEWAAEPISLGPTGSCSIPLVIGPSAIPFVTYVRTARAMPALTVLSAMAHGNEGFRGLRAAVLAGRMCLQLPDPTSKLYLDRLLASLDEIVRRLVERDMDLKKFEYKSDFARKYYGDGLAASLKTFLVARGFALSDEQRARIDACSDPAMLELWIARAAVAPTVAEVLTENGEAPRP